MFGNVPYSKVLAYPVAFAVKSAIVLVLVGLTALYDATSNSNVGPPITHFA